MTTKRDGCLMGSPNHFDIRAKEKRKAPTKKEQTKDITCTVTSEHYCRWQVRENVYYSKTATTKKAMQTQKTERKKTNETREQDGTPAQTT